MCFLPLLPFFTCWLRVLLFPWLFAFFLSALDLSTLLISFLWLSITVWGQFLLSWVPFTCSIKLYKPYFYENYFYLQESLPLSVFWPTWYCFFHISFYFLQVGLLSFTLRGSTAYCYEHKLSNHLDSYLDSDAY